VLSDQSALEDARRSSARELTPKCYHVMVLEAERSPGIA